MPVKATRERGNALRREGKAAKGGKSRQPVASAARPAPVSWRAGALRAALAKRPWLQDCPARRRRAAAAHPARCVAAPGRARSVRLPPSARAFPACLCPASCALQRACSGARPFRRARLRVVRRLIFALSQPLGRCERLRRSAEGERAAKGSRTGCGRPCCPCSMIGGKTRRVKDLRPSATAAAELSEYWPPSLTRYLRPRFCGRRLANRC